MIRDVGVNKIKIYIHVVYTYLGLVTAAYKMKSTKVQTLSMTQSSLTQYYDHHNHYYTPKHI